MFCHKCGNKITEGAGFCHKCGVNVAGAHAQPTNEKLFDSGISANENMSGVPAKSEAFIQSYNTEGTVNLKIKVFCNGKHIGTINKGESITVPVTVDSLFEFKCAFRKTRIMVKAGKRSELKLDFEPSSGKLRVFDMQSGSYGAEQERLASSRKWWARFAIIIALIGVLGSIVINAVTSTEDSGRGSGTSAYVGQTGTESAPPLAGDDSELASEEQLIGVWVLTSTAYPDSPSFVQDVFMQDVLVQDDFAMYIEFSSNGWAYITIPNPDGDLVTIPLGRWSVRDDRLAIAQAALQGDVDVSTFTIAGNNLTIIDSAELISVFERVSTEDDATRRERAARPEDRDAGVGQGAAAETELDARLFGSWVEQGDFPAHVILARIFNPDGTGRGGDGPGYEFVWWTDGGVLTMDAHDYWGEWTDVFRYVIVGDTMTFTHADGWQRVYIRDDRNHLIHLDLIGRWTIGVFGDWLTIIFYDNGTGTIEIIEDGIFEEDQFIWEIWFGFGYTAQQLAIWAPNDLDAIDVLDFNIISNNRLELFFSEGPIIFNRE